MNADILERAYGQLGSVLDNVKDDQLDDPTPCVSWKVRDVINHVVGTTFFFAGATETGSAELPARPPDFASGDFRARFAQGAQRAIEAFRAPDALDKTITLPFGTFPGAAVATIAANEAFTHGWDIATATGQSLPHDEELAEQLLHAMQPVVPDHYRGADGTAAFGPIVEAPADAPAAERLARFLGRHG